MGSFVCAELAIAMQLWSHSLGIFDMEGSLARLRPLAGIFADHFKFGDVSHFVFTAALVNLHLVSPLLLSLKVAGSSYWA